MQHFKQIFEGEGEKVEAYIKEHYGLSEEQLYDEDVRIIILGRH